MSTIRHSGPASPFQAVLVVGSYGALNSFRAMTSCLGESFPAAIVFDLHRSACSDITEVLRRRCALPVRLAEDGLTPEPANVYLAPKDEQLVIGERGGMRVLGPREGVGHRFADELLTSAATALGPHVIAVVLSGRLERGAQGVRAVKHRGGRVIVEDPRAAPAPAMPRAALATGCVDFVLPPERLGHALVAMCAVMGGHELFRVRLNAGVSS